MLKAFPGTLIVALMFGIAASAQQPATTQKPAATTTKPPAEGAPAARAAEPAGQPVNVKLDLTITDQIGPREPAKKTVTVLTADRTLGSVRSTANTVRATLNVDATPTILSNGNVRVNLGIEYNPRPSLAGATPNAAEKDNEARVDGGTSLNERITVVLEPGKPLVVSQAADPMFDRKITVEIRASVLR